MATFFSTQLDFIFFFYGLAFMLLGAVCFGSIGSGGRDDGWIALGLFGYTHGALEWMDLFALVVGDDPFFAGVRLVCLTASFLFLMEFARVECARFGRGPSDRSVFGLLACLVVGVALAAGLPAANAVARYTIGFVSALAAAGGLARRAATLTGDARRFASFAASGFLLYAVTDLVVAPAPFWPASSVNTDAFVALTGTPIQLWRGLLGCWIAFSVWSIRQNQLALELASRRYTDWLRTQFVWTLAAIGLILLCGWLLTNYLGKIYNESVVSEARGDLDLLSSRLARETEALDGMAKTLAGSPSIRSAMLSGDFPTDRAARNVLDLHIEASGAERALILDRSGKVVAAAGGDAQSIVGRDLASQRFFSEAVRGAASRCFVPGAGRGIVDYQASEPIRGARGEVIGVASLAEPLIEFDSDLLGFDRAYFLLDPDGVVAMTNRPQLLLRPTWPLTRAQFEAAESRFGPLRDEPLMKRKLEDEAWAVVDGERYYVRRRMVPASEWSLTTATPTHELFASRVLGIIVTLLATMMTLIYLVGKERRLHDGIQMDKRLRLQELARDLGQQAVTDPLTGLFNRLKIDQVLADEMLRASRYGDPFSLVLIDVDNFKSINDAHGHQTGDKTLVRLSDTASEMVRRSDVLARWGGEEFVLLTRGADGAMAQLAAEKLRAAIERLDFEDIGQVTCSFGVTQYADGDTAEDLVSRADRALYLAKLNGRNRVEAVFKSDEPAHG